jgi:hypothetical protein
MQKIREPRSQFLGGTFPASLVAKVFELARAEDRSVASVLREGVRRLLDERERP